MRFLCEGETDVAVAFFAGHFSPKPPWRFESAAAGGIGKFHLRNDKTRMAAAINIDLNPQTFPWNFVTHFSQSSPSRTRPKRCELFWAYLYLAFFAVAAPTDFERERCSLACLSQANLSTSRLGCQITLLDNEVSRPLEVIR